MTTLARSDASKPVSQTGQVSDDPRLHLAIIEANLALFRGERGEALRYLADYNEEIDSQAHHPLILWLDAQAQENPKERIERLRLLTSILSEDNLYYQLAKNTLENEERYAQLRHPKPQAKKHVFGIPRRIFFALIVALAFGLVALLVLPTLTGTNSGAASATADAASAAATQEVSPTLLPIHNVPLASNGYDVQYSAGHLEVMSVEDSSQRVVGPNGEVLAPILGARFYALEVRFECQIGICDTPPEAALTLEVDDQLIVSPRDGAAIQASDILQPIARGSSTSGWIIFEIPATSVIDSLLVTPKDSPENTAPLVITLGATAQ